MAGQTHAPAAEDIYFTARDGLRIHARRYPARPHMRPGVRPVLCLPGLTRNGRDFHVFAGALASDGFTPRDVYTIDYRGRGLSDHDTDWRNYAVPIEMLDVVDFMTFAGLHDTAIVGTSRGGLIAMVMAAAQPSLIGTLVLNDIGPIVEPAGLARISAYVGRVPLPSTWGDAAKQVRDLNARAFPSVGLEEWEQVARQWYNERNGRPAASYDTKLSNALSVLDGPMPALWPQFEALKRVPLLVLRGENSDILSAATVEEMRRRHPRFAEATIAAQGHAPLLRDEPSISVVRRFLEAADQGRSSVQLAYAS
ncbi:MAG: alpha/beta fold hydrolase [Hyphomicrobium sp.]